MSLEENINNSIFSLSQLMNMRKTEYTNMFNKEFNEEKN